MLTKLSKCHQSRVTGFFALFLHHRPFHWHPPAIFQVIKGIRKKNVHGSVKTQPHSWEKRWHAQLKWVSGITWPKERDSISLQQPRRYSAILTHVNKFSTINVMFYLPQFNTLSSHCCTSEKSLANILGVWYLFWTWPLGTCQDLSLVVSLEARRVSGAGIDQVDPFKIATSEEAISILGQGCSSESGFYTLLESAQNRF